MVDTDDDNDLLPDTTEVAIGTDPCNADSDGDGMQDGWEYQSSIDLNTRSCPTSADYPVPCAAAMPSPTRHRSYPNPLDSGDGASDYDGDGMTASEEYQGWKHKVGQDPTYFALTGPKGMWYSAGKKASVDTSTASGCRGMAVPDPFNGNMHREEFKREDGSYPDLYEADGTTVKTEYEVYSLDRRNFDGCLDDGERDEDGDFLTNFEEAHSRRQRPGLVGDRHERAGVPAWPTRAPTGSTPTATATAPSTASTTRTSTTSSTSRSSTAGLRSARRPTATRASRPACGSTRSTRASRRSSRATCPTYMPLGNPGAWRPFFADMSEPLGPRWPLYRTRCTRPSSRTRTGPTRRRRTTRTTRST